MNRPIFQKPDAVILGRQRSGTHFLEASLASHPNVHGRGECVLGYVRNRTNGYQHNNSKNKYVFTNKPGYFNIAIVMYNQIETFERLCGSIFLCKVIHLLRRPIDVARSEVQKRANREKYGQQYKSHFYLGESQPPNAPIDQEYVEKLAHRIFKLQEKYLDLLETHSSVFTTRYEDITNNKQTSELPEQYCKEVLLFLELNQHALRNRFKKNA